MNHMIYRLAFIAFSACAFTSTLAADPPKPASKSSLDDELLKGLDNDLTKQLDDLPSLKPKSTDKSSADTSKAEPTTIIDGEDIGQPSEDQDPFGRIARRMRQVESRVARNQAGADTQQQQQQIVDDLTALIAKLNKQCQGGECKPGDKEAQQQQQPQQAQRGNPQQKKSKQPSPKVAKNPASDSGDRLRSDFTAKPSTDAIRQTMKEAWGNLPERLREQMLQTSVDEFLPKYELMIEQYFKRLAEEESHTPGEPQGR